ncbi:gamma-glutamyltransferase [Leptothoe kymatousa]|uniref:Glutathione hydrolase proenzyme n=1 Tax=Leptothoe kymatousa TAU-MAC 1615 TaxID=2364775 RepID=A0ABS5Y6V7_9CYAN|nr:gamma-glutamyltransferase [Leptothoe kymatousa]MBT9313599.1 gamma-glutamyltransferase [Leptothoe kymatousa TAU-MAC 1615]
MEGVVAAGHKQTAAAAVEVLNQGGNAFDAAVAGVLAACVAESVLTSLGGGGFLLAHPAAGESVLFDFFSQTPAEKALKYPLDFYPIYADFGDTVQEFHVGLGSMAVPGVVKGLVHVHRRLGRLPLAAVAAPAIDLARNGVVVNEFFAYVYQLLGPILLATERSRAIYAPQGDLLKAGETLYMPDFANSLERLVDIGMEAFWEQMAAHLTQTQGGYLTPQDFANYQIIERQPLCLDYHGTQLLTNPPPSAGGGLIACTLALLADCELKGHGSPGHLLALSQAMRFTNVARRDGYDARLHDPTVAEAFLSSGHLNQYRGELHAAIVSLGADSAPANKLGSTTHLSVIDGDGNAASVTTSNGEGSSHVMPGTDIMINNMLGEEDLNPHGFHQWQPNQRISSMMAPTMVLRNGRPYLVLGSGGSNRIRTAILQVISNLVDFQMPLESAVAAPRIHWENNTFHLEPGYDRAILAPILGEATPVWWQAQNMFFGGVHAVGLGDDGDLHGAGDPRRQGSVAVAR